MVSVTPRMDRVTDCVSSRRLQGIKSATWPVGASLTEPVVVVVVFWHTWGQGSLSSIENHLSSRLNNLVPDVVDVPVREQKLEPI